MPAPSPRPRNDCSRSKRFRLRFWLSSKEVNSLINEFILSILFSSSFTCSLIEGDFLIFLLGPGCPINSSKSWGVRDLQAGIRRSGSDGLRTGTTNIGLSTPSNEALVNSCVINKWFTWFPARISTGEKDAILSFRGSVAALKRSKRKSCWQCPRTLFFSRRRLFRLSLLNGSVKLHQIVEVVLAWVISSQMNDIAHDVVIISAEVISRLFDLGSRWITEILPFFVDSNHV